MKVIFLILGSLFFITGCAYWKQAYIEELNKPSIEIHSSIYDSNYNRIGTIDSH